MNIRHLLATSAATALLSPLAHAAGDTAQAQPAAPASGADLPTISVTDTRHLPESFDRRYASTQVLTREDLDRLSPADPSITQALATLPGVTVAQNGGPGSSASVSIRGSSASQVAVFIDGIRIGSPTT
ncbi:TonB-dependent receptor, partial [Burkholderia cenocepacia]